VQSVQLLLCAAGDAPARWYIWLVQLPVHHLLVRLSMPQFVQLSEATVPIPRDGQLLSVSFTRRERRKILQAPLSIA